MPYETEKFFCRKNHSYRLFVLKANATPGPQVRGSFGNFAYVCYRMNAQGINIRTGRARIAVDVVELYCHRIGSQDEKAAAGDVCPWRILEGG